MALWPHVPEVNVLRAKVCSVPVKPGQSRSVRVNPRPRPRDDPCHRPGAPLERLCLCACAVLRGRVGLRNGGVHVLRPAVGRGRPAEPPAADYAASRRPGKSALFALGSGIGGQGAGARPGCGALRGAGTAGMSCGVQRLRARAASWRSGGSALLRPPSSGSPAGRPGCRPYLLEPAESLPEGTGAVPAGTNASGPLLGKGDALQVYFQVRELSLVGRTSEHQRSRPTCLPQIADQPALVVRTGNDFQGSQLIRWKSKEGVF